MTSSLLVIEDELGIRDFLERGLRDYRYAVDTAADGTTGVVKALNGDYDLVMARTTLRKQSHPPDRS